MTERQFVFLVTMMFSPIGWILLGVLTVVFTFMLQEVANIFKRKEGKNENI